jgi:hypothetical protein
MPRSKSKGRRYQPPTKKKSKSSPRWFGPTVLSIMGLGVIFIVTNYLGIIPGTHKQATNMYLFVGLGLIALGFLASTQWR